MLLFCGHVSPPGTSSRDKAQVIAAARSEWSDLFPATRTERRGRTHAQRGRTAARRPPSGSLEALWNLTVLCYGLRILS